MRGGRLRISEKQFATRANPASQWSINDKLSFYMPPVGDNYTGDNWLVDSDAFMKAAMSMNTWPAAFKSLKLRKSFFTLKSCNSGKHAWLWVWVCSCMFRPDLSGFSISAWGCIRAQRGNQAGQSNNRKPDNEYANVIFATGVSLETQTWVRVRALQVTSFQSQWVTFLMGFQLNGWSKVLRDFSVLIYDIKGSSVNVCFEKVGIVCKWLNETEGVGDKR